MKDDFTPGEVASACGISTKSVRRAIARGELVAFKFSARITRIKRADLESWMERCRTRNVSLVSLKGTSGT